MTLRETSSSDVRVILPVKTPTLTVPAARALLAILIELTAVPVLEPVEGVQHDG